MAKPPPASPKYEEQAARSASAKADGEATVMLRGRILVHNLVHTLIKIRRNWPQSPLP